MPPGERRSAVGLELSGRDAVDLVDLFGSLFDD
jgi:hypothetical protein